MILRSVLVMILGCFLLALAPLSTIALLDVELELFEIRFRVLVLEETPLRRANAMNAFRGFERFSKSLAVLLRALLLEAAVEEEEGPFRNAGDDRIRGCKS